MSIDGDGSVDVDEVAAGILVAHGFVSLPWSTNEQDSSSDRNDAVATLNRSGLFSFLRSRGVSVSLPITNEELRAAARKALETKAKPLPPRDTVDIVPR